MTLSSLDTARELRELRTERDELKQLLLNLLLAPWSVARPYVVTKVCIEMSHPAQFEGARSCPCGTAHFEGAAE